MIIYSQNWNKGNENWICAAYYINIIIIRRVYNNNKKRHELFFVFFPDGNGAEFNC